MNKNSFTQLLSTLGSMLATPKGMIIALATIVFLVAFHFITKPITPTTASFYSGPGTNSISAIGSSGLFGTLKALGRPVVQSEQNCLDLFKQGDTLVIAEPNARSLSDGTVKNLLGASKILIVLPKWTGVKHPAHAQWITKATRLSPQANKTILEMKFPKQDNQLKNVDWPSHWTHNKFSYTPSNPFADLTTPTSQTNLQLLPPEAMTTLIACEEGILLGEVVTDLGHVWVLSDPDIMANHGIGRGDNVALMVEIFDSLAPPHTSASIIFDESIHSLSFKAQSSEREDSPVSNRTVESFEEYFLPIGGGLLAVLIVLLFLAGNTRFGPPNTAEERETFDKSLLIDNSARLLDYAGYQKYILARYIAMTIQAVAQKLNAPTHLSERELIVWLDRIGKNKGISIVCGPIAVNTAAATKPEDITSRDASINELHTLFENAQKIHRWKGEILNEPATDR